jgi:hypothetical protein
VYPRYDNGFRGYDRDGRRDRDWGRDRDRRDRHDDDHRGFSNGFRR